MYRVAIHWVFDNSVSVHHFESEVAAYIFFNGAVEDADYYSDASSVKLWVRGNDAPVAYKIYKD